MISALPGSLDVGARWRLFLVAAAWLAFGLFPHDPWKSQEAISFGVTYHILDSCVGCQLCRKNCSAEAISGEPKGKHWIDQDKCHKCGVCFEVCPPKVFSVEKRTGKLEIHTAEGEPL